MLAVALFLVGATALAFLPTSELTLTYDVRDVAASLLFLALTIAFFSLVWKVCCALLGSGFRSVFAFVSCLLGVTMAAGAFPVVANAVQLAALPAVYLLIRGAGNGSQRTNPVGSGLLIVFLIVVLMLLPSYLVRSDSYEYTGAFFLQPLLPLKRFSDLLYHHTLVSSILSTGVASTGLNGVVADAYHVGGHYFLAGVIRLLRLPMETSPGTLTQAASSILALTAVMFGVYGFQRHKLSQIADSRAQTVNPAATALLAGLTWIAVERICSVLAPFASSHLGILSNAVALPSAGLLALFSILMVTALPPLRKELMGYGYVMSGLVLFAFACMSKISSGLIAYCIVTAAYGLTFIFTQDRRDALVKGAIWLIGGAVILYASYKYVAIIGASGELLDAGKANTLFRQTRGWFWNGSYAAAASLLLWAAYLVVAKAASTSSLLRLTGLHLAGPLACMVVLVSGIIDRRVDMAYFWISSVQISLFSSVVAIALLASMALERLLTTDAARRAGKAHLAMPIAAAAAVALCLGFWNLYSSVGTQQQRMTDQVCGLVGKSRCAASHGADGNTLLRVMSPLSPVAKIAYAVRSRGLAFDPNVLLVIDKRTGFFKSEGRRTLKMNRCYYQGWLLYAMTGTPIEWGLSQGNAKDDLCETPTSDQAEMWRRYGYGSYPSGPGVAREHSVESLREECKQPPYRSKRFYFVDKDFKGTIVDCRKVAAQ